LSRSSLGGSLASHVVVLVALLSEHLQTAVLIFFTTFWLLNLRQTIAQAHVVVGAAGDLEWLGAIKGRDLTRLR